VFAGLERKSDLNKVGSISTINKNLAICSLLLTFPFILVYYSCITLPAKNNISSKLYLSIPFCVSYIQLSTTVYHMVTPTNVSKNMHFIPSIQSIRCQLKSLLNVYFLNVYFYTNC